MKPLLYFNKRQNLKNLEERSLVLSIEKCLKIEDVEYSKNEFLDYDFVHFIGLSKIKNIEETKEAKLPTLISVFYCENNSKSATVTYHNDLMRLKGKAKKALKNVDLITVPGEEAKNYLLKKKITTPIMVWSQPIDIGSFNNKNSIIDKAFFRYFTEREDAKYVLSIGDYDNSVEMKNLLDIASLCKDVKFYFFGANYHRGSSKYIKEAKGNIVFSDLVEPDIYRSALINAQILLVLDPNKVEATNVLEAMAAKTQIISFIKNKNLSFLVDGENCYFVQGSFNAAHKITDYLAGQLKSTTINAYKYVNQFSLEKSAKTLKGIYSLLFKEKN